MRMMRCKTACSVKVNGTDTVEHFWPGLEVNFDRELRPGFSVSDAVAGNEALFEPIGPSTPAPAPAPQLHSDEEELR